MSKDDELELLTLADAARRKEEEKAAYRADRTRKLWDSWNRNLTRYSNDGRCILDMSDFEPDEVERLAEALRRKHPEHVYECLNEEERKLLFYPFKGATAMCAGSFQTVESRRDRYHQWTSTVGRISVVSFFSAWTATFSLFMGLLVHSGPLDRLGFVLVVLLVVSLCVMFLSRYWEWRFSKIAFAIESVLERAKKQREKEAGLT